MENVSKTDLLIAFGEAVRLRRQELGVSQEQLALKTGLHRTYIGTVERGGRNVALANIWAIALGLETTPDDLMRRTYVLACGIEA